MEIKLSFIHGRIQLIKMFKPSRYRPCPHVIFDIRDSNISIWHGRYEKAFIRKGNVLLFDESFKKGWTVLVANYDGSQVYYDSDDRQLELAKGLQVFEDCLNIIDFRLNEDTDNMIIDRIIQHGGTHIDENIQSYNDFRYEDHELYKNAFFNKILEEPAAENLTDCVGQHERLVVDRVRSKVDCVGAESQP